MTWKSIWQASTNLLPVEDRHENSGRADMFSQDALPDNDKGRIRQARSSVRWITVKPGLVIRRHLTFY